MSAARLPTKQTAPKARQRSGANVSSERPSTPAKMARPEQRVNDLRAVASGTWDLPNRSIEVDIVENLHTGEKLRMVRIRSVFEGFASSTQNSQAGRSMARLLSNSNGLKARPKRYGLAGQSYAHGITADEVKALITATVDRALAGRLHPKQRGLLAFFRALEKALVGEALEALIDRACGVAATPASWQRTASRLEEELAKAAAQTAETSSLVRTLSAQLAESRESIEALRAEHALFVDSTSKVRGSKVTRLLSNIRAAGRLTAKATRRKYAACRLEIEGYVRAAAHYPRDAKCSFESASDPVLDAALLASEQELHRAQTYANARRQESLPLGGGK